MTIIYKNGGEVYLGEHTDQNLDYWKLYGKNLGEKYMYKGYRLHGGWDMNNKTIVIVYDSKLWDLEECKRRKENGFLNIRRYEIYKENN